MKESKDLAQSLSGLIGDLVVLDTRSKFLYIGTLEKVDENAFVLKDADVHDCSDSNTSTDLYLIETAKMGLRVNRQKVYVLSREVVSVSRLSDIVLY